MDNFSWHGEFTAATPRPSIFCLYCRCNADFLLPLSSGISQRCAVRSIPKSIRVPSPNIEAVEHLRRPGGPFAAYPSLNAALVGLIRYAIAFPTEHTLSAGIARLAEHEQDLIDDFLARAAREGIDLREMLPKPATAEALLALARSYK